MSVGLSSAIGGAASSIPNYGTGGNPFGSVGRGGEVTASFGLASASTSEETSLLTHRISSCPFGRIVLGVAAVALTVLGGAVTIGVRTDSSGPSYRSALEFGVLLIGAVGGLASCCITRTRDEDSFEVDNSFLADRVFTGQFDRIVLKVTAIGLITFGLTLITIGASTQNPALVQPGIPLLLSGIAVGTLPDMAICLKDMTVCLKDSASCLIDTAIAIKQDPRNTLCFLSIPFGAILFFAGMTLNTVMPPWIRACCMIGGAVLAVCATGFLFGPEAGMEVATRFSNCFPRERPCFQLVMSPPGRSLSAYEYRYVGNM